MNDILSLVKEACPPGIIIDDLLGSGGQGSVFRGSVLEQAAAIKIFRPETDQDRVLREVRLLATIDCPYVVKLLRHETITLEGSAAHLVAYEFHGGGDFKATLSDPRQLDSDQLIRIAKHTGAAIKALWDRKVVHRDIKPANLVRADDGRTVLVDFGFVRHLDLADLTAIGAAPGTNGYKSPEQARGRRALTLSSDVFSLGVTLYELAAKQHPFGRDQSRIGRDTPLPVTTFRPDLPAEFANVLSRMLEPNAWKRPRDLVEAFAYC